MRVNRAKIPLCSDCDSKTSLFCCLSSNERDQLSPEIGQNFYQKGQAIFYEGNHPAGVYCIYSGKVKLAKLADNGKEQIVRLVGAGDVIGYRSMLSNESYRATATCIEDTQACLVPRTRFMQLMSQNFDLSKAIIKVLAEDLRRSEQTLIDLAQKTVRERMAETLIYLKGKFGLQNDGRTIDVFLSRREIGDIVGITTETSIRTLSDFRKEGLIEFKGKAIQILRPDTLATVANIND